MQPPRYEPYENLLRETLPAGEVHVWCVSLNLPEHELARFEDVLSADERERAGRFRFAVDRNHFTTARGVLRYLLGRYARIPAAQLQFREGAYGKPELSPAGTIRFNVSHSGGLGLYAIANSREVGVDIEQHRTLDDLDAIARHYFAPGERLQLEKLNPEERNEAFFRCWSRKEAFVKAVGAGLSRPLDSFCVSVDKQPAPAIQGIACDSWALFDITPCEGYSAALVTESVAVAIRCAMVEDAAKLTHGLHSNGDANTIGLLS